MLDLAGNCGRVFLFALLLLALPSYHAAVPGAYITKLGEMKLIKVKS